MYRKTEMRINSTYIDNNSNNICTNVVVENSLNFELMAFFQKKKN